MTSFKYCLHIPKTNLSSLHSVIYYSQWLHSLWQTSSPQNTCWIDSLAAATENFYLSENWKWSNLFSMRPYAKIIWISFENDHLIRFWLNEQQTRLHIVIDVIEWWSCFVRWLKAWIAVLIGCRERSPAMQLTQQVRWCISLKMR